MKFKRNLLILSAILIGVLIVVAGCLPAPTTPVLDTVKPKLSTAVYTDVDSSGTVNKDDKITFTFDDEMNTTTVTSSTVATNLLLSDSKSYGTSPAVSWDSGLKICYVTLGTSPTIVVGTTTVNPSSSVTDIAGNADDSSAVTITGTTTTVLSSVSISPSTATATVGTTTSQSFTASALSTAGTTMTSSCTFTWSISPTSERGSLSATSGTTVTYTLPATGVTAGDAVITVFAVKTGTTTPVKTATATVTVSAAVLSSVSISPSTAATTTGGAAVTLSAAALNTAGGSITSLCTLSWSIIGIGTISPTTGSTIVYTPPLSGTGTATITVTAVYAGVPKTGQATITVGTTTPPTPLVDPAKLFVSAQTATAKYTALPAGATSVTVYKAATKDPVAAVTGGVKATITLNDWWTAITGVAANDYIYFMITYSDGTTSPVTYDGQLPDAPDNTALAKIQATSKNTVTSTAAGNVAATDKISLYVAGARKSDPAPVGSTMTFVYNLAAGDVPLYTRTNPDGHESAVSVADGQILALITAADGGTVDNALATGDTITLGFTGGLNVDVTANITISNISWVTSGTATLGTGTLRSTIANQATVVLTATATCTDFAVGEMVAFNILTTTPIVDTAGGNQVLPRATAVTFTDTSF